jgi:hypothetical protein
MSEQVRKQRPGSAGGEAGEQAQFVPVDVAPTDALEAALADAEKAEAARKAVAADNARRADAARKAAEKAEQDRERARKKVRHACCCC